jgi:hypothetical protein
MIAFQADGEPPNLRYGIFGSKLYT